MMKHLALLALIIFLLYPTDSAGFVVPNIWRLFDTTGTFVGSGPAIDLSLLKGSHE